MVVYHEAYFKVDYVSFTEGGRKPQGTAKVEGQDDRNFPYGLNKPIK